MTTIILSALLASPQIVYQWDPKTRKMVAVTPPAPAGAEKPPPRPIPAVEPRPAPAPVAIAQDEEGYDEFEFPLDIFREIDEADLSWWPADDIGFEFSGSLTSEFHFFGSDPPGLTVEDPSLRDDRHHRFHRTAQDEANSPEYLMRLDAWVEAFFGEFVSGAAQGRLDRGPIAPDDGSHWGVRLEQAWIDIGIPEFSGRAGKFSAPIGSFIPRHEPKNNPFITFPLPYDHMTNNMHNNDTTAMILGRQNRRDSKDWRSFLWREMYGYGVMLFGSTDEWEYAAAMMTQAPSSWPWEWEKDPFDFVDPNFMGRLAFKPDIAWKVGMSGSHGGWQKDVPGFPGGDDPQLLVGMDVSWAEGDWEVWAEAFYTKWQHPLADDLVAWSYYVEAKYQVLAGLYVAGRFGQMFFDNIRDAAGAVRQWDRDHMRYEAAVGYFFTRNFWIKANAQQNHTMGGSFEPEDWLISLQLGMTF